MVLFFQDEVNWKGVSTRIHYLGAELRDISVSFQVITLMNCVSFPSLVSVLEFLTIFNKVNRYAFMI